MAKTFMSEEEFNTMMKEISSEKGNEGKLFVDNIRKMKRMLNETDNNSHFGKDSWRSHFGWED